MTAEHQVMLWGAATCTPVALAYVLKAMPALGVSTMLLVGWSFARVLAVFWSPPECMALYPVIDAAFGAITFGVWRLQRQPWQIVLSGLFVVQCTLHAAFWLAYPAPNSLYEYVWLNNSVFALELLCCGWGAVQGVARDFVHRMLGRSGRVHHARTWPP